MAGNRGSLRTLTATLASASLAVSANAAPVNNATALIHQPGVGQPGDTVSILPDNANYYGVKVDTATHQATIVDQRTPDGKTTNPTYLDLASQDIGIISKTIDSLCSGAPVRTVQYSEKDRMPAEPRSINDSTALGTVCAADTRQSIKDGLQKIIPNLNARGLGLKGPAL